MHLPNSEEKANNPTDGAGELHERNGDSTRSADDASKETLDTAKRVEESPQEAHQLGEEVADKQRAQEPPKPVIKWISRVGHLLVLLAAVWGAILGTLGECHYRDLTRPQAQLEEVNTKLSIVVEKLERARRMCESSDNISGVNGDLLSALGDGEEFIEEARTAILKSKYDDASDCLEGATECLDAILLPEAQVDFESGSNIVITSAPFEGWMVIGVGTDTTGATPDGQPVHTITASIAMSSHTANVVLAYDIEPSGAIFSHPIAITFGYLPSSIPYGFREEDLVIAWWDEDTEQWKRLLSSVDPAAHEVTTWSVLHLTTFAVVALPPVSD